MVQSFLRILSLTLLSTHIVSPLDSLISCQFFSLDKFSSSTQNQAHRWHITLLLDLAGDVLSLPVNMSHTVFWFLGGWALHPPPGVCPDHRVPLGRLYSNHIWITYGYMLKRDLRKRRGGGVEYAYMHSYVHSGPTTVNEESTNTSKHVQWHLVALWSLAIICNAYLAQSNYLWTLMDTQHVECTILDFAAILNLLRISWQMMYVFWMLIFLPFMPYWNQHVFFFSYRTHYFVCMYCAYTEAV